MFERLNVSGLAPARTDAGGHRPRLTSQNGYAGGRQEATEDPVIADMQDHWLPGFNFNVLALTRAVFAVAVEETPASS
jgi:hypothetical protein